MSMIPFLGEWAVRSSVLIAAGALLLRLLRVKNPSLRLTAWTAILAGSLAIPLLATALPKVPVAIMRALVQPTAIAPAGTTRKPESELLPPVAEYSTVPASRRPRGDKPFEWVRAAALVYAFAAGALLLRLFVGLYLSLAMLRRARPTGIAAEGIDIRESDDIASPVTAGIFRPIMLLPPDWRKWDAAKLAAIVAHERSHVRRRDPVVQFVSAIHRSLLWVSPFSWFLHRSIIRTAEEVSDDDAVAVICDRVSYAEILLEFTQRSLCQRKWMVVQMARYDRPEKRIRRVLNSASGARRITRWGVTAVLAIASPLAYVVAAAHPQVSSQPTPLPVPVAAASTLAPQQPAAAEPSPGPKPTPVQAAPPAAPSQEKPPSFDAASVKPFQPDSVAGELGKKSGGGGPGTSDPGRIHYQAIRVKDLILRAYDVKDFQIVGPDWLNGGDSTRYRVDATMPPDTTPEQFRAMLRSLLADRFKLAVHKETRDLPFYSLVVSKSGLKIKESAAAPAAVPGAPALPPGGRNSDKFDAYGFPIRSFPPEGGIGGWLINGRGQVFGVRRTMQQLADELVIHVGNTPVTNDTGLTGKYNFTLTYSRPRIDVTQVGPEPDWAMNPPEGPEPLGDIFGSIQTELGLKLEPKKGPRDVIVIDHIEKKPTDN